MERRNAGAANVNEVSAPRAFSFTVAVSVRRSPGVVLERRLT
jgi:hypothetical protein